MHARNEPEQLLLEIAEYDKVLQPFNNPRAEGRIRANADGDNHFTIK